MTLKTIAVSVSPPTRAADSFVALMYHDIREDGWADPHVSPASSSYFVSSSAFAQQMAELSACGAHCMTWPQLQGFYTGNGHPVDVHSSPRPVLLTFDDGWRHAVDIGGPILDEHRAQATLFITTDFLGRQHFLSRRDVTELPADLFRVGSHARSHRMLCLLDDAEVRAELSDSRKLLEDLTGYEIDSLSIPNGAVDQRVRRIAAECGYRYLFDSEIRINRRGGDPLAIGRVPLMHATPLSAFRRYVQHRVGWERFRRAVLHAPKRLLGLRRYDLLRRQLLGEKLPAAGQAY